MSGQARAPRASPGGSAARRGLSVSMVAAMFACLVGSLPSARACTVAGDLELASHSDQWLAAAFVVEGTALQVEADDYDFFYSTVLLGDITTTKGGERGCNTLLVSGFFDSSLCGVDPPLEGSRGTFYLCSLITREDGSCTAELNTVGDVFIGSSSGVSLGSADPATAPATCPQEDGTCLPVSNCKGTRAAIPTPAPTIPTPAPAPATPDGNGPCNNGEQVWPPNVNSECAAVTDKMTIRPTVEETTAWLKTYDNIHKCFKRCRQPKGYVYIVEDKDTGDCFCYNSKNDLEWEVVEADGHGNEVLYGIQDCFKQQPKRVNTSRSRHGKLRR